MAIDFQEILSGTLETLRALPMETPESGLLAGFTRVQTAGDWLARYDNRHFPAGTAYYQLGVRGVAQRARESAALKAEPERRELLLGIADTYEAVGDYFARYAAAVRGDAMRAAGTERLRLTGVAERLDALSCRAPESFAEAVQLMYLMWGIRNLGPTSCIGRLDVHLRPFYERDIDLGRTTREEVFALICELWERLNRWGSGDTLMNVMVGGSRPDGSDDSSDLSLLMLEASLKVGHTEPHINVRWHSGIRQDVMEAAYRLQLTGSGQATVYNDDVILPEMLRQGIPPEIACRYANDGCTELVWDGCGRIEFNHIDAVATLELALYNGRLSPSPREKIRYFHADNTPEVYTPEVRQGFASGEAEACADYASLYALFLRQYLYQIDQKLEELRRLDADLHAGAGSGLPFLNGTYEQVLESGVNIMAGGLSNDSHMVFLGSVPTVADCLAALKQVVYERKHYTLAEVKQAMEANFEGYEVLRAELLSAPKFGNDLDEVDLIAAGIAAACCDHFDEYRARTGFRVFPALLGWRFVQEAYGTGAMPDGRRRKDPIAEHYCATPGKARNGVTALVNSIAKAPLYRALGVAAVHLSLPRSLTRTEAEGLPLLRALNEACLAKGLMQYNIAIYDADVLRAAQRDPERYGDVVVRVWGFSARFVDLSREMQDHIIQRALPQ